MTEFDRALKRYDAENQNRPLPRIWFFVVGTHSILRSRFKPKPILWDDGDGRLKSYKLTELNECDRVAVYK